MVVKASHIPLYVQIEQSLLHRIQSGELAAYDQVPSEQELAQHFGVSRMTARKALDRLVGEGVVFRQPGKGTFVASPKIAHRLSSRLSFSTAMDALGLRQETRVLQARTVPAPARVALKLSVPQDSDVVLIERLRTVEGDPAALHTAFLPGHYERILEEDLTKSLLELIQQAGTPLTHTRDVVEAVAATSEEARLLGVRPGAPLLRQAGVGFSAALEPLRYTEGLFRGDRFRFNLDSGAEVNAPPEFRHEGRRG